MQVVGGFKTILQKKIFGIIVPKWLFCSHVHIYYILCIYIYTFIHAIYARIWDSVFQAQSETGEPGTFSRSNIRFRWKTAQRAPFSHLESAVFLEATFLEDPYPSQKKNIHCQLVPQILSISVQSWHRFFTIFCSQVLPAHPVPKVREHAASSSPSGRDSGTLLFVTGRHGRKVRHSPGRICTLQIPNFT